MAVKSGRRPRGGPLITTFITAASALCLLLILLFPIACRAHQCGNPSEEDPVSLQVPRMATILGGAVDVHGVENSVEVEELALFAVEEHNKKENALLELSRVVSAKTQVVSGIMHHFTLEVIDGGKKQLYEAQVWVQSWLNSKKLHEFKHVGDAPQ